MLESVKHVGHLVATPKLKKKQCEACGCHMSANRRADKCHKCMAHSFVNLKE